jgi:hypothetical protein
LLSNATCAAYAECIVLLNKTLFVSYDFKFPVTLTGWHLCFTAATLWTACKMVGVCSHFHPTLLIMLTHCARNT